MTDIAFLHQTQKQTLIKFIFEIFSPLRLNNITNTDRDRRLHSIECLELEIKPFQRPTLSISRSKCFYW